MFTLKTSDLLCTLVEQLLPTNNSSKGIRFNLRAQVWEYGCKRVLSKEICLVVTERRNVFFNLKNTSNHDSCWKSDGIERPITDLYFAMCVEYNPLVPPKTLENELTFNIFKKPWEFVKCNLEKDGDYKQKLIYIEKW